MATDFDSLREGMGPLEITLFEGITFNSRSSSVPTAYEADKKSNRPGISIAGYIVLASKDQLGLSFVKETSSVGGVTIYRNAVQNIRLLQPVEEKRAYE